MTEVVNSLKNWQKQINLTIAALASTQECIELESIVKNTDLEQFEEVELAKEFRSNTLDKIALCYKQITERDEYFKDKMNPNPVMDKEDIEISRAMNQMIGAGFDFESLKTNGIPEHGIGSDSDKFELFTKELLFNGLTPKYDNIEAMRLHSQLMNILTTIVESYKPLFKHF